MTSTDRPFSAPEQYYPSIENFESADIDAAKFNHHAHVYVGWCYLQECPLLEGVASFTHALRRLTKRLGADKKYNETISWFFLVVIAERIQKNPGQSWADFRNANIDLCDDGGSLLRRYYSGPRLQSTAARELFLLPDKH
jgi:hypothetical protein